MFAYLILKGLRRVADPLVGLAFKRVGDRALAGLSAVLAPSPRGAIGTAA